MFADSVLGYSGVVIYTKNATCAPIRAEEGITGILTPPNTTTSFRDLPEDEQIGGYPTISQLSQSDIDATTLDSEGRCVILEFPAFVLIGTYCPAERDETRTEFRTGFLNVLDSRIRNLVKMGKRVIWTGDLNISREEIDTAMAEEMMRKNGVDPAGWISTPARRMLNQMLVGGKVHGDRDEGREDAVMWDVCRAFNEGRKGMYTCWETKVNARPGNYGARIDYVVSSHDMKDWWSDANIQEGLMGSDHCPVYGVFHDTIPLDGVQKHILDLVNPPGMFEGGIRVQEWSSKCLLPMSGKLITEFDRRRNIRDMFSRTPSMPKSASVAETPVKPTTIHAGASQQSPSRPPSTTRPINGKRPSQSDIQVAPTKKSKVSSSTASNGISKGQQSLRGFFSSRAVPPSTAPVPELEQKDSPQLSDNEDSATLGETLDGTHDDVDRSPAKSMTTVTEEDFEAAEAANFASKQSWGKLFSKPIAPKCEHDEPCKTMLTKKPGANRGRSFWMCNRPLGPKGQKESGTQWRCGTFIWCSDWDTHAG
jgi:AP endonuclease 2